MWLKFQSIFCKLFLFILFKLIKFANFNTYILVLVLNKLNYNQYNDITCPVLTISKDRLILILNYLKNVWLVNIFSSCNDIDSNLKTEFNLNI